MSTETKVTAYTPPPPKAAPVLADAASSGDGLVHQILADRQTAYMNGDADAADAATARLAELGYC